MRNIGSIAFDSYLEIGDDELAVDVEVDADIDFGCEATWDDPGIGRECVITQITRGDNGGEIEFDSLSRGNQDRLEKEAWEHAESTQEGNY